MSETEVSRAAKTLSKLGASKGGVARAEKMTPEERKEVASKAASVRWGIPRAEHIGDIHIGDMRFPCSVLSDGTRILTQSDFMEGMGMYYSGWVAQSKAKNESSADTPHFLAFKSLEPFIDKHLGDLQSIVVKYRTKDRNRLAHGIKAEIIPKICEVWLDAERHGKLGARQKKIAEKADVLIRALAHVGIVALVDAATGYEKIRDRDELNRILEAYIAKELLPWTKRFPDEYWKEICRLRGWKFDPLNPPEGPRFIGKIVNYTVYDKLPGDIRKVLREKNPVVNNGRRRHKHFQFLTEDIGNPHLEKQIISVTTLMRIAPNWKVFEMLFEKAFPNPKNATYQQLEMTLGDEEDIWKVLDEDTE
jgi:hypothetical protein